MAPPPPPWLQLLSKSSPLEIHPFCFSACSYRAGSGWGENKMDFDLSSGWRNVLDHICTLVALSWSLFTDHWSRKKTDQVGDMDNTDVSSDYTSNCLPPNCLPRWRYLPGCLKLQPIEKMMFVMVFWQLARENDNKSSADPQQGPVQWHSGQN